jgi:hypothetical protein
MQRFQSYAIYKDDRYYWRASTHDVAGVCSRSASMKHSVPAIRMSRHFSRLHEYVFFYLRLTHSAEYAGIRIQERCKSRRRRSWKILYE